MLEDPYSGKGQYSEREKRRLDLIGMMSEERRNQFFYNKAQG